MRRFFQFVPVILLMLFTAGCEPGAARLGPSGLPKGNIAHVVVIWMTDRGDEFAKKEIFADTKKLEHVSGVVSVVAGRVLPSDRPKVDNSFDIAFIMTFHDETDLRHYTEDKTQIEVMTDVLRFARDVKVYDMAAE